MRRVVTKRTITMAAARRTLPRLVEQVHDGTTIVITHEQKPMAVLCSGHCRKLSTGMRQWVS
jgi:antitoxin (DNA-binding transcriptional repressor) of toxin-antitoxin stability system